MMKKYNKPEIVTLALDVVDVIETSAVDFAAGAMADANSNIKGITKIEKQVTEMKDSWTW